jgi:protein-S-isoprenylcysteine O-methyltransferase Ste14
MKTTPTLVFVAIASTLLYLGLAILGWGSFAGFFNNPARSVTAIATVVMAGVALFSSGNLSPGEHEDRSNRWVIGVFGLIGLVSAYLPAWTDRHDIWILDGEPVRWIGVALFCAGGALRMRPVFVLGHRFSGLVAIQPRHTLVTSGIYGTYPPPELPRTAHQRARLGSRFSFGSRRAADGAVVPPLIARIRAEERLLHAKFGSEYEAYCSRTSRLIPGIY